MLVEIRAAAINPGEIGIRRASWTSAGPRRSPAARAPIWRASSPTRRGGAEGFETGDEVVGWSETRSSHAEFAAVPATQLTAKPAGISWEVAGSLFVAPLAAYACVQATTPRAGEIVAVSGAGGGVGSVAVQLARLTGATVIGLASEPNHAWLRSHDIVAVTYGEGQGERILWAADGHLDAFIDTFGGGYVDLALELGVPKERINTIADFAAIERLGVGGLGTHAVASADVLRRSRSSSPPGASRSRSRTPTRWHGSATRSRSWRSARRTGRSC